MIWTLTRGETAVFRTFPWPENQVSVQPPMSLMRSGVEEWMILKDSLEVVWLILSPFLLREIEIISFDLRQSPFCLSHRN